MRNPICLEADLYREQAPQVGSLEPTCYVILGHGTHKLNLKLSTTGAERILIVNQKNIFSKAQVQV